MNRYTLTKSQGDTYICHDETNNITCSFKQKLFNETQKFEFDPQFAIGKTPQEVARIVNEIAEWLRTNHYAVAMPLVESTRLRIAARVRDLRTNNDMSQAELADLANIPQSHLSRIEAGKYNLTIDVLDRIAHGLGYTIDFVENMEE